LVLGKFRDEDGNWRENIDRLEKDILKVSVSSSVQECETERFKVSFEREQEVGE